MTQTAHIVIVDPGAKVAELDAFNRLQQLTSCRLSYHLPAMFGMDSIEMLEVDIDAVVILGSACSVYDDDKWIAPLKSWTISMIDSYVPVLGLCFGHQLVADIMGCKIGFLNEDKKKLLGLREITFVDTKGFWKSHKKGQYIVSHRETVTDLGPDVEIFAKSKEVEFDGIRHKTKPIWGMQSHPEAGPGFLKNQSIAVDHETPFQSGQQFMASFFKMIESKAKH